MTDPTNATVTHTVNACVGAGGDTGRSQLVDFETTRAVASLASSTMSMDGLAGAPELNELIVLYSRCDGCLTLSAFRNARFVA